jgi:regulatory protein
MASTFSRDSSPKSKRLSPAEAYLKIRNYCAYQERAHKEVKNKLFEYGLYASEVDEILSRLITDGFLNEERFAKAFAGGKFRIKKWGRVKIQNELEMLGLTPKCVRFGLREIDERDYRKTLYQLIEKKSASTPEENLFKKRDKIARYAIAKGFEPELVWESVKELLG